MGSRRSTTPRGTFAGTRCSRLRSYDLVVRYGGDEFVCAFPGATAEVAQASLARVRSALDRMAPGATVSAGWAELEPTETLDDVIHRVDTELYEQRRLRHPCGRRPVPPLSLVERRHSVACGECGGRVALAEFVLELTTRMTRVADCPDDGATTVIELSQAPTRLRAEAARMRERDIGSSDFG